MRKISPITATFAVLSTTALAAIVWPRTVQGGGIPSLTIVKMGEFTSSDYAPYVDCTVNLPSRISYQIDPTHSMNSGQYGAGVYTDTSGVSLSVPNRSPGDGAPFQTVNVPLQAGGTVSAYGPSMLRNGDTLRINASLTGGATTKTVDLYYVTHWNDTAWCTPGAHSYLVLNPSAYYVEKVTVRIDRSTTEVASIDSRTMHGQPNAEGALPGLDANAPPRNLVFKEWIYKGGLFAGYAPPITNDQSGKARIQIRALTPPTLQTGFTMNLGAVVLHSVAPSNRMGPVTSLTMSAVPSTDPNYSVALNQMRWDNKWTTSISGISSTLNAAALLQNSLVSFYFSTSSIPTAFQIQSANETSGTAGWHYFSTPTYAPQVTTSNANPRVWYVMSKETVWANGGTPTPQPCHTTTTTTGSSTGTPPPPTTTGTTTSPPTTSGPVPTPDHYGHIDIGATR